MTPALSRLIGQATIPALAMLATGCGLGTTPVASATPSAGLALTQQSAVPPASPSPTPFHPRTLPPARPSSPSTVHAGRPLTILVIGDSLGEDLGYGLKDLLGSLPQVRLVLKAVGSTGLANAAYYNWPKALAEELQQYRPNVVVTLLGGNDAVGFMEGATPVAFGSRRWQQAYGQRVATLMQEATSVGAQMIWVGLPIMSPASVLPNPSMKRLNAVYTAEAIIHPEVHYVSTWALFEGPQGGYTDVLKASNGQWRVIRDPDGVHIAPPAGNDLIASAVLQTLDTWWRRPYAPHNRSGGGLCSPAVRDPTQISPSRRRLPLSPRPSAPSRPVPFACSSASVSQFPRDHRIFRTQKGKSQTCPLGGKMLPCFR